MNVIDQNEPAIRPKGSVNMTSANQCPECGTELKADAPRGLCPRCLVQQGMAMLMGAGVGPDLEHTRVISPSGPARPATADSATGHRRFGDYELISEIAHGGMGVVYRARQISLNRPVALKMILSGQLATSVEVQRFRVEAEAAAKLDHPNIVPIYEIGEWEAQHYFSMKLVEGGRLSDVTASRSMPPERAVRLLVRIARAVHYAHQHGVLHRDLKPNNILLDAEGEPHLTDFGLAKILERETGITQTMTVLGTASYMAPEQAAGETKRITTAVDVYGLGAILYEMLTGRPPFQAATMVETLRQVVDQDPLRPSILNRGVDRDLETICLKCLEKSPGHRYESAEALAVDLERWAADEPILARPSTTWERTLKWARRKPAIASLLGLLILVAAAGLAGVFLQWNRALEARKYAELTAQQLRRNLYIADMNLARRALEENNLGRAVQLIQKYVPAPGEEDLRGFEWRYLWQKAQGDEQATIRLDNYIKAVTFSPDGRWLASGGHDAHVLVWETATKKLVQRLDIPSLNTMPENEMAVGWSALQFSPDGKYLVTEVNMVLHAWETTTWREAGRITNVSLPIIFLAEGTLAVVREGVRATFIDTKTWKVRNERPDGFTDMGRPQAISGNGRYAVAIAQTRSEVQLWDLPAGKKLKVFPLSAKRFAYNYWTLSPDGQHLAAGNWSGQVTIWDCRIGCEVTTWQAHASPVYGLAFAPNGSMLVTAGHDQMIQFWENHTWKKLATLKGHLNEVWTVGFSPDGQTIATGGKDATLKFWSAKAKNIDNSLRGAIEPLFFTSDGHLAARRENHTIGWWDLQTGRQVEVLSREDIPDLEDFRSYVVSPSGNEFAGATEDGRIILRMMNHQPEVQTLRGPFGAVIWMQFSTDGKVLAVGSKDTVKVWNCADGRLIAQIPGLQYPFAFAPDGSRLAAGAPNYAVQLWDIAAQKQVAMLRAHKWGIWSLTFSPDNRHLLVTSIDANASLWDAGSGKFKALLSGHKEGIPHGSFSPDSKTIVTGSTDETVKLWSTDTYQELVTLSGFGGDVSKVLFSPDGSTLAIGCNVSSEALAPVHICRAPSLAVIDAQIATQATAGDSRAGRLAVPK